MSAKAHEAAAQLPSTLEELGQLLQKYNIQADSLAEQESGTVLGDSDDSHSTA